jgi:putative GTP pyrophosphokinase
MVARRSRSPQAAAPFTKGEINRAGELMLDLRERMRRDGPDRALVESDEDELEQAREALRWWRSLHARPLSTVAANLRYHVDCEEGRIRGRTEVTQRLKRFDTMIDKLAREQGRITQMHDIGGVRAVLPSLRHVYVVGRRLRKSWMIIRVRDYITEPKNSGYRALHLVVQRKGYAIEVQLRTIAQDVWANTVEQRGMATGVGFKFGAGDADVHAVFVAMSEVLARFDRGELSPEELRAALETVPS